MRLFVKKTRDQLTVSRLLRASFPNPGKILLAMVVCHSSSVMSETSLPLECLANYRSLLKPVQLPLVFPDIPGGSAWDLKNAAEYNGPVNPSCAKVFGSNAKLRIVTEDGKLFYLHLESNNDAPLLAQHFQTAELSRMEAALRQNGSAYANLRISLDGGVNVSYSLSRSGQIFSENIGYIAYEAKYKDRQK
jgi:hypothetical protein